MSISFDRPPTRPYQILWKIIKNHENHNILQIFRSFCATAPPATPQNDHKYAKSSFLNGAFYLQSNYADPGCGPKSQLLSCNFKVTISDRDSIQLSRMESSEGRCRSNALIWCDTFIIFERHPPLLCTSNSRFQRFRFLKSLTKSTSVPSWLARE